ncbi:hypothetical protein [Rhodococcus sp. IEGM 1379]|uniref:hypothetical protein n=1 Tax=Rhodococcus sp. IEGM 1379 TaxID=3047086 RepID=UPI0024B66E42|nr:hypothetical protein [Rhodococcus sp. IEGM 1379]MDI9914403.1 hypothetical protein [Rhodococcus sp. IEGM 1379]
MTEQDLVDNRDDMSLTERVEVRRALDAAAGVRYDVPPVNSLTRLARIVGPGLRRISNQK